MQLHPLAYGLLRQAQDLAFAQPAGCFATLWVLFGQREGMSLRQDLVQGGVGIRHPLWGKSGC